MPTKSNTYKFEYYKRGSNYNHDSDYRRFVTLDYNLTSYVGIVGVGIISGWDVEEIAGLQIQINPGRGIADGYSVESPYTAKKRSEMVMGDREVEIIHTSLSQIPNPNLTDSERAIYVSIIQAYDPSYAPVGPIENANVKTVIPTVINLFNNVDNYIYAKRPSGAEPYPLLLDYPYPSMERPFPNQYPNYTAYLAALRDYQDQIAVLHAYQWRTSDNNHFTAVEFETVPSPVFDSTKILLAKITTRNSSIYKIDLRGIDSLENMKTSIEKQAKNVLVAHHHGGKSPTDPTKIRLETDIRDAVLKSFDSSNGVSTYTVTEREKTSVTNSHKHTYAIDSSGNGYTVGIYGDYIIHFHIISAGVLLTPAASSENIPSHIHTLPTSSYQWTTDNPYVIYINNKQFADQNSSNVEVDPVNKLITLYAGVGGVYKTYSTEIIIDSSNINYTYSSAAYSVYSFMLSMISDFNEKYAARLLLDSGDPQNVDNNPFLFMNSDGTTLDGLTDLQNQCQVAQELLVKNGDTFTFTPNAAKNITIVASNIKTEGIVSDKVTIEILGNVEVTGVLKTENVFYINAKNITLGKFDIARIPFVNHLGRMGEQFHPFQSSLISNDGIKWTITPSYTDVIEGHYHSTLLNQENSGVTQDTFVGEEPVYYEDGQTGNSYLIAHTHSVVDEIVSSESPTGLNDWYNDITNTVSATSNTASEVIVASNTYPHTHTLLFQDAGDPKTVYSVLEDSSGNIFAGTSSGFYMIPYGGGYLYVVNGEQIYMVGENLWNLLLEAKGIYEDRTELPLPVTEEVYQSQIAAAEETLSSHGDSFMVYGATNGSFGKDSIMIKKLDYFEVPNFKYTSERMPNEVNKNETIVGVKFISSIDGSEISPEEAVVLSSNAATASNIITEYIVERNFNDVPIWSIETKNNSETNLIDIYVVGSDVIAKHDNMISDMYEKWNSTEIPFYSGSLRKVSIDAESNVWLSTGNGLLVSRDQQEGEMATGVSLPSSTLDVKDVLEAGYKDVFCAAGKDIFETNDSGKTWTTRLSDSEGFSQILRDVTKDKTDTVYGHYHALNVNRQGNGTLSVSIGSGTSHIHNVNEWNIEIALGHTHVIIATLYAVTNSATLYKSEDGGISWIMHGSFPYSDRSNLFAYNGSVFGSYSDGLYKSTDNGIKWVKILDKMAFSFQNSYDRSKLIVGCHDAIYEIYDTTISLVISFTGMPQPIFYRSGSKQYYGYAYSNKSNSFHFYDVQYIDPKTSTSAIVGFNRWVAERGQWEDGLDYDIYVDGQPIISTARDIDKRIVSSPNFEVIPSEGVISYSALANVSSQVNIFDISISVANVSGFSVGDRILLKTDIELPSIPVDQDNEVLFQQELEAYGSRVDAINNMYYYGTITALSETNLFVSERFDRTIELPASVHRIAPMEGSSNIYANIYQSMLTNIGSNSHTELENKFSYISDSNPKRFNDVFLSNLLQLTQAIKYIYPTIDSDFKNAQFYDMHYSNNPLAPNYIGNFVDVIESETSNEGVYGVEYVVSKVKGINALLIGHGTFDGFIIAATDLGIFWSKIEDGMEANWFYVNGISEPVYDIKIFNNDTLNAATISGIFSTKDMKKWNLLNSTSIAYPIYTM